MTLKLLICGGIKGKLDDLYKKVSIIEKKSGKFDSLFCIGDFFGEDPSFINDYLEQKKKSNVETFIISQLPESLKGVIDEKGSQICGNITFLGDKGVMKCGNKLHLAFVSKVDIVASDVKEMANQLMVTNVAYSGVDMLLTNLWPAGIDAAGGAPLPLTDSSSDGGSDLVAALTALVQPRYHFSGGSEMYYERQPYRNQKNSSSKPKHVTRFIALSSYKNKNNDKYLYALQLQPMELMTPVDLLNVPANTTDSPFSTLNTSGVLSAPKQQFFFEQPNDSRKRKIDGSTGEEISQKKRAHNTADGCWFCLGNPQVERHLVVHVGNTVYIAMPRGPLTADHMMILTVGHYQSLVACPIDVVKEIRQTMRKISSYFSSQRKSVVFFERNFKTNHFQLQVVPAATEKLEMCKTLFLEIGATENGPGENFREIPSRTKIEEIVQSNIPYFYVELSDGTRLFGTIPRAQLSSFNLQFGRIVLSNREILNCPEKVQWKDCTEDFQTEEKMTKNLKKSLSEIL